MDKYINSEASQHIMKLLLLGANVQVVSGKTVYVKFNLNENLDVAYVYHINKHNKYYLERIKPYPLAIREFDTDADVVEVISIDYIQYKNAINSHNITHFVDINKNLHKTAKAFEDLFLYYNISDEVFKSIENNIADIHKTITQASKESKRLFFDKDPENL